MADKDDKYFNPETNPWIQTGDDDGNPKVVEDKEKETPKEDDLVPCDLSKPEEETDLEKDESDQTSDDELEKAALKLMEGYEGPFELQIEDGGTEPMFNIVRTADGGLEISMPNGKHRKFSDLSLLEKKLIAHAARTKNG